jgi:arylsulfatase A-like enzyme
LAFIAALSSAIAVGAEPAAKNGPPNVLLIVSDDQGYRDLSCFGGPEIQTPNLDRLAKEGVRATSYYVTWPACTPSRGSILTGRYPLRNGLYDMIRNDMVNYKHRYTENEYAISPEMTLGLDLREVTIAQALKKAGYATGAVGKWDSGRAKRFLPTQRGFDSYYGFANTGIDYWTHERYGVPSMFRGNERIKEEGFSTHLFRREALRFIEQNKDRPFFLYVAFNAPHSASSLEDTTVQAPEEAIRKFYPNRDSKDRRTKYMACVSDMDEAIGELLAALKKDGLEDNTLVLFQSDNGGGGPVDNAPLRGHKSQVWEGGLRVPLIARWPGHIPPGTVTDGFLTTLELFPTIIAATGAEPPRGVVLDGFDMMPILEGKTESPRTEMFWEHNQPKNTNRAARVGQYKWVDSINGGGLFDLSTDIGEKHDLSAERPEALAKVKARWAAWKAELEAAEPRGPFRDY